MFKINFQPGKAINFCKGCKYKSIEEYFDFENGDF